MTLTAEQIQVGKTYRAKRPRKAWGEVINDRVVLYVDPVYRMVQYDSETVGIGRHYPKVSMDKFLRWAASEVVSG